MAITKQQIIDYYDTCEIDYKLVWNLNQSLAMHYGYWDETTRYLSDALQRENQILAKRAKITKKDHVLDAGCGVGGSSIYLAQAIGCKVTGITLSKKQVQTATRHAEKFAVSHLVRFRLRDYTATKFPDNTFDAVWAIESVCHAGKKEAFLKEAYRVLRKGGRLIVADFFATKKQFVGQEKHIMDRWLSGWALHVLANAKVFCEKAQKVGFKKISYDVITPHVLQSARRLYLSSFPGFIAGKLLKKLHLRTQMQNQNIAALYYQYKALQQHLWEYGIFYAEK